jgi:hypothetical protein
MNGKIALTLAALAVAVMAGGPVSAGCNPSKEFQLAFGDSGNFDIFFPADADINVTGAVIGHIWTPGARATTGDQSLASCDDFLWLYPPSGAGSMTIYGSNGSDLGNGLCDTTACPAGGFLALVQTKSTDNSKAYYTVGRVSETAPLAFDFARTQENWNAVQIPKPMVFSMSRNQGVAQAGATVAPPDAAFHAPAADAFPASGTITGYQLVTFTAFMGTPDPGREAALWTPVGAPLPSSNPSGFVTFPCPDQFDVFLASRPIIDGFLTDYVSASQRLQCAFVATPGSPGARPKPIGNKKEVGQN